MASGTPSLFSSPDLPGPAPALIARPGERVRARVAVAPCKLLRGFQGDNLEQVRAGYVVRGLISALTLRYRTDAHLVTYVVDGARRQPRINKLGLASFPGEVRVESFFCDVDNPDHAPWDRALARAALDRYERLEVLRTAGLYFTRRGLRLVQPLAASLPVLEAERALARWLAALEVAGIEVDWACRDWTRHFRLPHVVRDGHAERAPVLRLERMAPLHPELPDSLASPPTAPVPGLRVVGPGDAYPGWRASAQRVAEPPGPRYGGPRAAPSFTWRTRLDPSWMPALERIARAVRRVETEWHSLFLALAGALLERGAEPEDLPLLCRAISMMTGADDRTEDRELIGRSTAERSVLGVPVMGLRALRRRWPGVAAAFGPTTLRFRELVALLHAVGGSRQLALRVGVEPAEIRALLRGEAPRAELAQRLRELTEATRGPR